MGVLSVYRPCAGGFHFVIPLTHYEPYSGKLRLREGSNTSEAT